VERRRARRLRLLDRLRDGRSAASKNELIFGVRGSRLFEEEIEADVLEIAETHRRLACWLDGFHDATRS
jgi:hypothetical protein